MLVKHRRGTAPVGLLIQAISESAVYGFHDGRCHFGRYSLLLIAGGAMGYLKAKSKPSLIAGTVSGIIGLVAAILAATSIVPKLGDKIGLGLAAVMLLFFGPRFLKSKKFMPGGLMAILSIAVLVAMCVALLP